MSAFTQAGNNRRPSHVARMSTLKARANTLLVSLNRAMLREDTRQPPHSLPWVSAPRSCALGDYATPSDKPPRDAKPIHSLQDGTHGRASGAKPCQHQEVNCYRGIVSRQCLGGIGLAIVEAVVQRQGAEHGPMRN